MPKKKFRQLGLFYILALSCIALSVLVSQFLVQNYISKQRDDSRRINVAGRQRMLSQKISKLALKIDLKKGQVEQEIISELEGTLDLWIKSHEGLLEGNTALGLVGPNSDTVKNMFVEIKPHYQKIVNATRQILLLLSNDSKADYYILSGHIKNILAHEGDFLIGMDRIVFQYDKEANAKVRSLSRTEITLLATTIGIILLELFFVFMPLAKNIRATVHELTDSEKASKKMSEDMSRLYEELVRSYQDLEAVNLEPDSLSIMAKMNFQGRISYISSPFVKIMAYERKKQHPKNFIDLLVENGYSQDFAQGVLDIIRTGANWSGELKLTNADGDFCWLDTYIVPVKSNSAVDIVARDITKIKEAKIRSREINTEKIEKKVREQQYRSVLIMEGQEEERERLSRELHDGIGQMLTALKLNLESIIPSNSIHTKAKIKETRELVSTIIKETRRVSSNLIPSSLSDFGIVPAVKKFCFDLNNISGVNIF
ncbi:MAG: type IV pili methyl-accepting chemotaxis transducer N-terminal domain-containing protein, partial [Cyclobacteriaceae bacterium]|nr:type IV pili methyl-accepting chemotaxis transducer N-terminal domain-containing protein [Cyclobacteriaceae bacterium HetDA_MAG_MS6]